MTRRLFATSLPKGSLDIRRLGTATKMPPPLSSYYGLLANRLADNEARQLHNRLGLRLWTRPRKILELIKLRQLRSFATAFAISEILVNKKREDDPPGTAGSDS
jgi:hypothetical protein